MLSKKVKWQSRRYLHWLRVLGCCNCGAPSEGHHIIGVGNFSGIGMKAADHLSMPLCHECHTKVHSGEIPEEKQWQWIVETFNQAVEEGILNLKVK